MLIDEFERLRKRRASLAWNEWIKFGLTGGVGALVCVPLLVAILRATGLGASTGLGTDHAR